ncbi:hypothetical protein [Nannocystis pusilla]|uniref:hypothetical protein n=1 Tax=Nannocystis pusilla TaxID=889268 RepID=UPI003B75E5BF
MPRFQILVCDGPSCGITHESDRLVTLLKAGIAADPGLKTRCYVAAYNCFGRCSEGPTCSCGRWPPTRRAKSSRVR